MPRPIDDYARPFEAWLARQATYPDGVRLNARTRAACRYLEGRGLRWLVDFGYGNAIMKAQAWKAVKRGEAALVAKIREPYAPRSQREERRRRAITFAFGQL